MQLRGCAVRRVAGAGSPAGFKAEDVEVDAQVDVDTAPAIPAVVLSLLYPDRRDIPALLRLGGATSEAEWRISIEIGKRRFRITRGFAWSSVVLEAQDPVSSEWGVVARGADQVATMLGRVHPMATWETVSTLCFAAYHGPPPKLLDEDAEVSRVELLTAADMFSLDDDKGGGGFGAASVSVLDEQDRVRTGRAWAEARTRKLAEMQVEALSRHLGDVLAQMGSLVDDSGELARVARALSETPRLRPITPAEREALSDTEGRRAEYERRIGQADEELAGIDRSLRSGAWYRNVPLLVGVLAGIAFTVASLTGGVHARKLALGNIVAFGIALAGALRHIGVLEAVQRTQRKRDAVDRRRQQLIEERAQFEATFARAKRELGVSTFAEYEARVAKRRKLEEREQALVAGNRQAFETPEYAALDQRRRRAEVELAGRKAALQTLTDGDGPADEYERTLRSAGWDPAAILWNPSSPGEEFAREVSAIVQIAEANGLVKGGQLTESFGESFGRVARMLSCEELAGLSLREGRLASDERPDLVRTLSAPRAYALVEALRLSVLLALRNAGVTGLPDFIVRVHPYRFDDASVEASLRSFYPRISERTQVVLVGTPA